ncbi:MAG: sigma-70 family RNA polymerase sigma factor [bacterium]|nr:sigma-70 family RNA polymerase sigma factor [bacterium]
MTPPPNPNDLQALLAERDWLRRLARRLLGDGPDADDLAQETLVRALERGPRGEVTPGDVRAWMGTVARRLAGERWRLAAHRREREAASSRDEATPSTAEVLERAALQRTLADEVMALPEPLRMAVLLRYFEGLDYPALAKREGIAPVAARKRVSRGIAILRDRLDARSSGRDAWSLALLPLVRSETVTPSLAKGALLVQTKTKLALALAVPALVAGGFYLNQSGAPDELVLPSTSGTAALVERTEDLIVPEAKERAPEDKPVDAAPEAARPARIRAAFPSVPESEVGTLDLRVTWSDGSAADGVGGHVMPWGADDAFLMERELLTDARGHCVLDQLAPGKLGVYLDRASGGSTEILAGKVTSHEVTLEAGVTVTGRVLDGDGDSVAGALVQLSEHGNGTEGRAVTQADANGAYRVRGIRGQRALSARAPGHGPSAQTDVDAAAGSTIELDLVLRGAGGSVRGQLLDPDGIPVAGARVRVNPSRRASNTKEDGRWVDARSLPAQGQTDEAGLFAFDGLQTGRHTILVRAQDVPPLRHDVEIRAGKTEELELLFASGGTLEGIVRTGEGAPATGAVVRIGRYGDFDSHAARVRADGGYRFTGLPAGTHEVRASARALGKTNGTATVEVGAVTRWDATLVSGSRAQGRVVNAAGAPLAGWQVGAQGRQGLWHQRAETDADGRFDLRNIPAVATTLAVGPPDVWTTGASLYLPGALPADEELLLTVPADAMPSATLTARVRGQGVEITPETTMSLRCASPWAHRDVHTDDDGAIRIERLRAGTYALRLSAPGAAPHLAEVTVAANESLDLGELVLTAGGRVQVQLSIEQSVQLKILKADGGTAGYVDVSANSAADASTSDPLAPGRYVLRARSNLRTPADVPFEIVAGETTAVQVAVEPAVGREIEVRVEPGTQFPRTFSVRVHDPSGEVYDEHPMNAPWDVTPERMRTSVWGLVVGTWRVVVTADDGRAGEVEVVIGSLTRKDEAIPLELR